eukprot:m.133283 g.133283  ORF g.133283 m.133283 type:complete len:243 (-) comp15947_c0_seq5:238-966(-)
MGQDWSTDSSECYSFTSRPEEEDLAVLASQAQAGFAYLQDSAEGVKQLHSQGVMHADIRPENTVYFKGPDKSSCSRGKYVLIDYDRSSYKDYPISRGHPAYGFQQVDQRPARPWHDWASIGMQAFLLLGTGRVWLSSRLEFSGIPKMIHTLLERDTIVDDIEKIFGDLVSKDRQRHLCELLALGWAQQEMHPKDTCEGMYRTAATALADFEKMKFERFMPLEDLVARLVACCDDPDWKQDGL